MMRGKRSYLQECFYGCFQGEVLYEGEKLRSVLNWYKEVNPKIGWATRYGINHSLVKEFLDKSEENFNTAQRILDQEDKSRRIKAKRNAFIGGVFLLITIGLIVVSIYFTGFAIDKKIEADNAKRDAKREKIAAQQAMNIAQEQAEKAEIASYAAKRDSIRSIEKNKEADIAKSQAIKALKQAKTREGCSIVNQKTECIKDQTYRI